MTNIFVGDTNSTPLLDTLVNRKSVKLKRKELAKNRLPSDVEQRRLLESFESAILRDEFYDMLDTEETIEESSKEQG